MNKVCQIAVAAALSANVGVCAEATRPVPVTYIMVCCHEKDKGTKFLANGEWPEKRDYRNYPIALDTMRKIKDAGINVVGIDMTNPSQWDQFKHNFWPKLKNVVRAAGELDMEYFFFLGNTYAHTMKYWNEKAKITWEEFAKDDPHYRRYGFGDDRPMMTMFLPGRDFAAHLKNSKPEEHDWLDKFRIGTTQVNDPIVPTSTDGWGYRNKSAGATDLARFVAPNSGVHPKTWARVDADEWRARVKWALGAKEYAVIGTYDDTCDSIFWGIADVRGSSNKTHIHESTKNDPYIYYNIVKDEISKHKNLVGRIIDGNEWQDLTRMSLGREKTRAAFAQTVSTPIPANVPDLMTAFDGQKITTLKEWETKRVPELKEEFEREEYGRRPVERPASLSFAPIGDDVEMMEGKAIRKRVRISYSGPGGESHFDVTAFIPKQAKPVPAFLLVCNRDPKANIDYTRDRKANFWPAEEIVARGYAALAFYNGEVAPDGDCGLDKGVFKCFQPRYPGWRQLDDWGTLSAWAWGASRVMDWVETEPLLDAKHVAVVGHSRGGKTALVAGVSDKRFAMACSNDSGCSGAKLNHIDLPKSEHVDQMIMRFNFWFCKNYCLHAKAEKEWRVDQHEYIALIAPRLVCIADATEDHWAGPPGEWWAAKLASPAWELYGKKGLVADGMPAPDTPQQEGCISYHIRTGGHDLTAFDWKCYMDFADRHGWRE